MTSKMEKHSKANTKHKKMKGQAIEKSPHTKNHNQNHFHKHSDNESHDAHSTGEDCVFNDPPRDSRHHRSRFDRQSHRSFSTSSTSITSSSSTSSVSSSSVSTSSPSSSSTTSTSSPSSSSDTDSDSSNPRVEPRHSRSCTDIPKKERYFDECDDTAPLLAKEEHVERNQKQDSVPQHGSSQGKYKNSRDEKVRKAKSMESLARTKEKEPQDEAEQEKRSNEARKNIVKEKIKFSAFLNEITRQVLSPMRLTSLGVANPQRSRSPVQSTKLENTKMKQTEQQKHLQGSADSTSSGKHSYSSTKHSHSHQRHYSHRSEGSPDRKRRSFKRHHSWHRSCPPSDKHHHHYHHHNQYSNPGNEKDYHNYRHDHGPTYDTRTSWHNTKHHHRHNSDQHQNTSHCYKDCEHNQKSCHSEYRETRRSMSPTHHRHHSEARHDSQGDVPKCKDKDCHSPDSYQEELHFEEHHHSHRPHRHQNEHNHLRKKQHGSNHSRHHYHQYESAHHHGNKDHQRGDRYSDPHHHGDRHSEGHHHRRLHSEAHNNHRDQYGDQNKDLHGHHRDNNKELHHHHGDQNSDSDHHHGDQNSDSDHHHGDQNKDSHHHHGDNDRELHHIHGDRHIEPHNHHHHRDQEKQLHHHHGDRNREPHYHHGDHNRAPHYHHGDHKKEPHHHHGNPDRDPHHHHGNPDREPHHHHGDPDKKPHHHHGDPNKEPHHHHGNPDREPHHHHEDPDREPHHHHGDPDKEPHHHHGDHDREPHHHHGDPDREPHHHHGDPDREPHHHHGNPDREPHHHHGDHDREHHHHHGDHDNHHGDHDREHHHHHGDHDREPHHHHGDHDREHHHHHGDHDREHHHHHGDHDREHHHHHGDHDREPHHHHGDHDREHHHHHGDHDREHHHHHEDHPSQTGHQNLDDRYDSDQVQSQKNLGLITSHHGNPVKSPDTLRAVSVSSQEEEQTSFSNPLHNETADGMGRIIILQEQNEGLQQSLLKTAVRVECLGEEFMSSRHCLEAELQKTRMELSNLTERFKRLHDNCSSTQQTNSLLEHKLHLVSQNMEGERKRLNTRISALTERLADAKFVNNMDTGNARQHQIQSDVDPTDSLVAPPPAQFMDSMNYNKDNEAGQEQTLGSVPEEEESDWSEIGEETPRFVLMGLNRGQAWRCSESDEDKVSGLGREEIFQAHSSRPSTIPQLQFTVHNDALPLTQTLSDIVTCQSSYKITTNPSLGSAVLVRSASLEEIPLPRHTIPEELRGTEAMMDLHHSGAGAGHDLDNEFIHHLKSSRETALGRDCGVSEMDAAMSNLQSAERILNHLISETQQTEAEVHGWSQAIPDELLKGERTKL